MTNLAPLFGARIGEAFITASTIYVAFFWRALRMKRPQLEHFENLPFDTATPAARHDAE